MAIKRISGHAGPAPGEGMERDYQVCKLVDITTCIGCKACEVACQEWNGYEFADTVFDNSYQTMPETTWNFWNLIKFNEHENADGTISLADAQGSVHALCRSGMPRGLSRRRRHRAIHQRHRRFSAAELHWLRILHQRLSLRHSQVQSCDQEDVQVHALRRTA